jgi:hypothetical protein
VGVGQGKGLVRVFERDGGEVRLVGLERLFGNLSGGDVSWENRVKMGVRKGYFECRLSAAIYTVI